MTIDSDGDVKRRFGYVPIGEVLFDQVFDAVGSPPVQPEAQLLLPLGDHQEWLAAYFRFYSHQQIHQALGYRTPAGVYRQRN
jgi:hypothetical protein